MPIQKRDDFGTVSVTKLTDSTTGTASNTLDDTTSSVKDDLASLAAKINEIIDLLNSSNS